MFWFFGPEACGILAPWPGIKPAPPALEGEVLTTGPPGKSLVFCFLKNNFVLGYQNDQTSFRKKIIFVLVLTLFFGPL